jgi:hypothetical protein
VSRGSSALEAACPQLPRLIVGCVAGKCSGERWSCNECERTQAGVGNITVHSVAVTGDDRRRWVQTLARVLHAVNRGCNVSAVQHH